MPGFVADSNVSSEGVPTSLTAPTPVKQPCLGAPLPKASRPRTLDLTIGGHPFSSSRPDVDCDERSQDQPLASLPKQPSELLSTPDMPALPGLDSIFSGVSPMAAPTSSSSSSSLAAAATSEAAATGASVGTGLGTGTAEVAAAAKTMNTPSYEFPPEILLGQSQSPPAPPAPPHVSVIPDALSTAVALPNTQGGVPSGGYGPGHAKHISQQPKEGGKFLETL